MESVQPGERRDGEAMGAAGEGDSLQANDADSASYDAACGAAAPPAAAPPAAAPPTDPLSVMNNVRCTRPPPRPPRCDDDLPNPNDEPLPPPKRRSMPNDRIGLVWFDNDDDDDSNSDGTVDKNGLDNADDDDDGDAYADDGSRMCSSKSIVAATEAAATAAVARSGGEGTYIASMRRGSYRVRFVGGDALKHAAPLAGASDIAAAVAAAAISMYRDDAVAVENKLTCDVGVRITAER